MSYAPRFFRPLLLVVACVACGLVSIAERDLTAQAARGAQAPTAAPAAPAAQRPPLPEGYWPRGKRPGEGLAPGMRITDLGKGGRTFRLNFSRGDEMLSGMVEFAQKHKIRNGHFVGLGAVNKAILGWTDTERGNGQKMIPVDEEAEVISLLGGISMNAQGVATVHAHGAISLQDGRVVGGHIFELHISIIGEVFVTEEEPPAAAP
jgi:predicted DNA-binding protein with PD1-like motif